MKLCKLEILNNSILGNLKLDFRNSIGVPANAVIIAGENGSGKSVILNILFEFSQFNFSNKKNHEKRVFEVQLSKNELKLLQKEKTTSPFFSKPIKDNLLKFSFDYSFSNWKQIIVKYKDNQNNILTCQPHIFSDEGIKKIFRSIFSDIGIDFTPRSISSITAKDTDQVSLHSERTNVNLATEITQLLIDIEALDSSDFKKWAVKNSKLIKNGTNPRIHMDKRMRRFNAAFKFMFEGKKQFLEIRNEGGNKKVYFKERNNEMPIEALSSGEKQIVFRGGFLLKDQNKLNQEFILIDEPEISLHPNWQLKILGFYKKLFVDINKKQSSQIFIATHSPFIVHSADDEDKVIVLEKNRRGIIKVRSNSKYFGWTNEVAIKKAFNINVIFDSIKPIIITEGKSDYYIIDTAWKKLYPSEGMPFDIIPSGIEDNVDERSGNADQVRRTLELISNISRVGKSIIGVFDNDREGNEQFKGLNKKIFETYDISKSIRKHKTKNIYGMLLHVPPSRNMFVTENDITQRYLEIEHYFNDSILNSEGMKGEHILGSPVFKINDKKKVKFSKNVKKYTKSDFKEFKTLFDEILGIL